MHGNADSRAARRYRPRVRSLLIAAALSACTDGIQPPTHHCAFNNAGIGTTTADYCVPACQIPNNTPLYSTDTCTATLTTASGTGDVPCIDIYETPEGIGCCLLIRNDQRMSHDFYFAECK